jgi:hypothetical protein
MRQRKRSIARHDLHQQIARAQVPRPSYWLLRPDGHVGLCGTRFDAASLRRYATDTLTMKWPAG